MKQLKEPCRQPLKEKTFIQALKNRSSTLGSTFVVHKSFLYKKVKVFRKKTISFSGSKQTTNKKNFLTRKMQHQKKTV